MSNSKRVSTITDIRERALARYVSGRFRHPVGWTLLKWQGCPVLENNTASSHLYAIWNFFCESRLKFMDFFCKMPSLRYLQMHEFSIFFQLCVLLQLMVRRGLIYALNLLTGLKNSLNLTWPWKSPENAQNIMRTALKVSVWNFEGFLQLQMCHF